MPSKQFFSYGSSCGLVDGLLPRLTEGSKRLQDSHSSQGGGPDGVVRGEAKIRDWSQGK